MKNAVPVFSVVLVLLFAATTASIDIVTGEPLQTDQNSLSTTSRKFQSVAVRREELGDDEFAFSFKKDSLQNVVGGIRVEAIAPPRHRLFGLPDVNIAAVRVFQSSGAVIPWHTHPRGSENYVTIKGTIRLQIKLEGIFNVRNVTSKLPPGHVTSIPQGLPHTVKCISKEICEYHIFFNTADAGFAPASESEKMRN